MTTETKFAIAFICSSLIVTAFYPNSLSSAVAVVATVTMFCLIKFLDKHKASEIDDLRSTQQKQFKELKDQVEQLKLARMGRL